MGLIENKFCTFSKYIFFIFENDEPSGEVSVA